MSKVSEIVKTFDKDLLRLENYVAKEHDNKKGSIVDYDRMEELISIVQAAKDCKDNISEEIDKSCGKLKKEITKLCLIQDKILRSCGAKPKRTRKTKKKISSVEKTTGSGDNTSE